MHAYICVYMRMYVYICVCMRKYAYVCGFMCIYVHAWVCMFMCVLCTLLCRGTHARQCAYVSIRRCTCASHNVDPLNTKMTHGLTGCYEMLIRPAGRERVRLSSPVSVSPVSSISRFVPNTSSNFRFSFCFLTASLCSHWGWDILEKTKSIPKIR